MNSILNSIAVRYDKIRLADTELIVSLTNELHTANVYPDMQITPVTSCTFISSLPYPIATYQDAIASVDLLEDNKLKFSTVGFSYIKHRPHYEWGYYNTTQIPSMGAGRCFTMPKYATVMLHRDMPVSAICLNLFELLKATQKSIDRAKASEKSSHKKTQEKIEEARKLAELEVFNAKALNEPRTATYEPPF